MKIEHLDEGVGRIIKGVNTTPDVGVDQTRIEAAKFGNDVDKDGYPPTLSSNVKGKSTNVLYNLGLAESQEGGDLFNALEEKWSQKYKRSINCNNPKGFSQRAHCQGRKKKESIDEGYKIQLERDPDMYVLHILDTKTGKRTEVRGKSGYESGGYDPDDKLHQLLDKIGKAANISDLMNGEVTGVNLKHPDGKKAIDATDKAHNEDQHPNELPVGPEFKPTMPQGTVRVKISDVYDWYKLGQYIADLRNAEADMFGKGPPEAILSFGSEDEEHDYIQALKRLGLDIVDVDPKAHDKIKGIETDPTYNTENIDETIRKQGNKYVIYSKDGDKKLGTYSSRSAAEKRLRQIEYFKHANK